MHVTLLVSIERLNCDISLIFPAIEVPEKQYFLLIVLFVLGNVFRGGLYDVIEGEITGLKIWLTYK